MYRAWSTTTGAAVAERLRPAHTHWTRLKGLLGTRTLAPGDGLWIKPCRQVHMLGMRYALDVVFLDADHRIVRAVSGLPPQRISPKVAAAQSVLELPVGTIAGAELSCGDAIAIEGEPETAKRRPVGFVGAMLGNVLLAALYTVFVSVHYVHAQRTGQWATTLPIMAQEALLVMLFLTRRRSLATSGRLVDWVVGIVGTFLPLLMRTTDTIGPRHWLGEPLQVAGLLLAVTGAASLGRSIGVVAANRGVKTDGPYRLVRHPMYAAYILSYVGYVASYPSLRNALITMVTMLALSARAVAEERLLAGDPTYREYLGRTRQRFVPYVY